MYAASAAFHNAVANGNPQKAMLIFSNCVFTNDDINVEDGIEFNDYFNLEEDISIGQTPSNEIVFSLFNDNRLLNDYTFGDFLATIGVLTGTDTYQQFGSVTVNTNYAGWVGAETYPYLKRNGDTVSQPGFVVKSLLGYDGKVWAFGANGQYAVYNDQTGANITSGNPVNNFMRNKSKGWAGKGMFYNKNSRMLAIYEGGERQWYEFVPLGMFTAKRPKVPDVIQIDMTCNDFMMKFDIDMPSAGSMYMTYPSTIGNLLAKMCAFVGVNCRTTNFINSGAVIGSEPEEFGSVTMREVLQWIAEAAGGNARFDRDGYLVIDWLKNSGLNLDGTKYASFDPYWYQTKRVTKLYNQGSDGSYEATYGNGDEPYLIQDNPLLRGVT